MHPRSVFCLFGSMLVVLSLTLAGCGGESNGGGNDGGQDPAAEQSAPTPTPDTNASPSDAQAPANAPTASNDPAGSTDEGEAAGDAPKADSGDQADGSDDGDDQAKGEVKVIKMTGNDQMQYNINEFTVKAGQKVKIEFEHVGNLPVQGMGHNVVIIEQRLDPIAFSSKCATGSVQNSYLPEKQRDQVIAFTEMIGGGESTSVTFTAPEKTGDYPYLCTFPAHTASGMRGTMTVQ
jgi:azurin